MKQYRPFLKKAIWPPGWLVVLLTLVSGVGLAVVFTKGLEESIAAYAVYPLSAYSVTVAGLRLARLWKAGRARLRSRAFYRRYSDDPERRRRLSLRLSLGLTLFYSVTKAAAGLWYSSAWFGSLAFYYIVVGLARYLLLRQPNRGQGDTPASWRKYRFCGYLLLVLTAALGAVSFHAVYGDRAPEYPGYMIYAAAAFAFYSLIMAVINLFRHGKPEDPVISAGRILSLATALVSVFFLQMSLFSVFGDGGDWQRGMNVGTGACVFLLIAAGAVHMIRTGNRALGSFREQGR